MGRGKKELLWEAHILLCGTHKEAVFVPLFESSTVKPILPHLESSVLEDIYDEMELIGFPVSVSMFDLTKSNYRGEVFASVLKNCAGQTVRIMGDFIAEKRVRTKNGEEMRFGTFLDCNGDFFDTVHFASSLKAYPLNGNGIYLISGKVVLDFGYPSIEVIKCGKMPLKPNPRSE